ncbi:histone H3 [Giardia muris]|uniref:Histone H3 n=1 Tax=Giardia muris TaxID=5742 RepID=A0A4Z1T8I9_GIAMU|nr:histone H3 [Giardia muris]|eukprot:TNJ28831.1 histone H3 [Giardia muris]
MPPERRERGPEIRGTRKERRVRAYNNPPKVVQQQVTSTMKRIYKDQSRNSCLFPRLPFARIVRDIVLRLKPDGGESIRFQSFALEALQYATETLLLELFIDALRCTTHGNRVTLMQKDINLALSIRRDSWGDH